MNTSVDRTYGPVPSRSQIEVYTSTDSYENLIDMLNKKTRRQNLTMMAICLTEIAANGWSSRTTMD